MSRTIAVFGATGRTGREFVKQALGDGYEIRALVRSFDKASSMDERIHITLGDFGSLEAIQEVISGADYVVCMAAAALSDDGSYPNEFMCSFVKQLYKAMERQRPKLFLYQAGSMSTDTQGYLQPISWIAKQTLGRKLGIFSKIRDNDQTIRFIGSQGIDFIVTRAGILKEGPMSEKKTTVSVNWPPLPFQSHAVTYSDLAACTIELMMQENMYNTCPFIR